MSRSNNFAIELLHATVKSRKLLLFISLLKCGTDPNKIDQHGKTALNYICSQKKLRKIHVKMIKLLIKYKADVNIPDEDGNSPIMSLFLDVENYKLRLKVFFLLLKNGADDTHVNDEGNAILHVTLYHVEKPNVLKAVQLLLNCGADVNHKNEKGHTPLQIAVEFSKSPKVVELLLENGANPNMRDGDSLTPLNYICTQPGLDKVGLKMIQLLVQYNADVNIADKDGDNAATNLFTLGDCSAKEIRLCLQALNILVQNGATFEYINVFGKFISHKIDNLQGIVSDVENEIESALKTAQDVNLQGQDGSYPLHKAVITLQIEYLKFLFKNGADPNIVDRVGNIPLNYIFQRFNLDKYVATRIDNIMTMLKINIEYGANLSHIGTDGRTILHTIIVGVSSYLSMPDREYQLRLVTEHVRQFIELLLQNGLDVNVRSRDGSTPLNEAVAHCNYSIAKILVEHGADVSTVTFRDGFFKSKKRESLNLTTTLNILGIIELLNDKGFHITDEQYSSLLKFLTLSDTFEIDSNRLTALFYLWSTSEPVIHQPYWRDIYELGFGPVIKQFIETLILAMDDISNRIKYDTVKLKRNLYKTIEQYIYVSKLGNMYMEIETTKYLEEMLDSLVPKESESDSPVSEELESDSPVPEESESDSPVPEESESESESDSPVPEESESESDSPASEESLPDSPVSEESESDTISSVESVTDENYSRLRNTMNTRFEKQVNMAKEMHVGVNISLLDLCTSSPDETYKLLKECDYQSVIYSRNFRRIFDGRGKIGGIIKGYIIKALVRRLVTQVTPDSIKLLFRGIDVDIPDLCVDMMIKSLDTIDLVSICEAAVSYKTNPTDT